MSFSQLSPEIIIEITKYCNSITITSLERVNKRTRLIIIEDKYKKLLKEQSEIDYKEIVKMIIKNRKLEKENYMLKEIIELADLLDKETSTEEIIEISSDSEYSEKEYINENEEVEEEKTIRDMDNPNETARKEGLDTGEEKDKSKYVLNILYNENGIYMSQRSSSNKVMKDLWQVSGGKVEKNETSREAAERETSEETDISAYLIGTRYLFNDQEFDCNVYATKIDKEFPRWTEPDKQGPWVLFSFSDYQRMAAKNKTTPTHSKFHSLIISKLLC